MAVVTAHTQGRYDIMTHAMSDAGIEPVIIEDILRIGEDRGITRGIARSVLALADARGLTLTDSQRAFIAQCADADVLDAWLRRAITAASADEIFAATRAT